ncbi:hypothetical protein RB594_008303 [Gaeumannomyces avenae]
MQVTAAMTQPPPPTFPISTSAPGEGAIVARTLPNGATGLEKMTYQYPLKLISPPRPAERPSALVFLLSYGGGLVAGDRVNLSVDVGPGARLSLVTQGHTKVFKAPPLPSAPGVETTRQRMRARVAGAGAGLCLLPDPVQPFADSIYEQEQAFCLAPGASLCLLDWVTQGRAARGEDWDFARWVGRNEVWAVTEAAAAAAEPFAPFSPGIGGGGGGVERGDGDDDSQDRRLLVRDAIVLDRQGAGAYAGTLSDTMHGHGVFGSLVLRGPLTRSLGEFFMAEFAALPRIGARDFRGGGGDGDGDDDDDPLAAWRAERLALERQHSVLWTAAAVRGCVVVKFGAAEVEGGRLWVGAMLAREGSVERNFGKDSMMCVR